MTDILLIAIVVMIFVVIFQIAKASEYVSILKGEEKARKQNNKINAFLLIAFLIAGLSVAGGAMIFITTKHYLCREQLLNWGKR